MRRWIGILLLLCIILVSMFFQARSSRKEAVETDPSPGARLLREDEIALERAKLTTQLLEEQQAQQKIQEHAQTRPFWRRLGQIFVSVLCGAGLSILLVSGAAAVLYIYRHGNVYYAVIDGDNIPVNYRDIGKMYPILTGLVCAKIQANISGQDSVEAEHIRAVLSDVTGMVRALTGQRVLYQAGTAAGLPEWTPPPLLDTLQLLPEQEHDEIVFGYRTDTHQPVFKSVQHCVIHGERAFEQNNVYLLLCQTLLLYPGTRFYILDPTKDTPESLAFKLPKTGNFVFLDPGDYRASLYRVNTTLSDRLLSPETIDAPLILWVHNLTTLLKHPHGASLKALLSRFASEGYEAACYCLFTGETGGTAPARVSLQQQQDHCLISAGGEDIIVQQPKCALHDVIHITETVSKEGLLHHDLLFPGNALIQ